MAWRNGTQPKRIARFVAVRVTPAHEWRHARLAPDVWLLCEEDAGNELLVEDQLVLGAEGAPGEP